MHQTKRAGRLIQKTAYRGSVVALASAAAFLAGCESTVLGKAASPAAVKSAPTIAEKIHGLTAMPGFVPMYWDARAGKVWLEIPKFDEDFLYVNSLPAGLGSNDIGLDRGQLGRERVVHFTRSGPKVLLKVNNLAFRAEQGTAAEKRAVHDSFAQAVLGGFDVAAEQDGRVLVDATAFFMRDAHDVIGTLKSTKQGAYALDLTRSAFHLPNTKNFPRNTEVEVLLTFAGNEPGAWVRDVAPEPTALTVRMRHSFVKLPEPGYVPRAFDPRAGYFPAGYADYSSAIGEPLVKRFITRHRLEKTNPSAARSPAVKPIVYHLDPATPEPVRSALLDGARWWSEAFEAAGFVDAFRVEVLPEDADPMDVRYNVIQWVHRATRGWSYGSSVIDPRTGEIIKGHVSLGSLRVRHDYLIAEGLLAPYEKGKPASTEMARMALARLRQLSAHEVGHTLGLAHNYISSASDRASVMDYPHPVVTLGPDGGPTLAGSYADGIGAWDKVAIAYGYAQVPDAGGQGEASALAKILDDARARGLVFLTDQDARPLGSSHPHAHLWDNGANAIDEFQRLLKVRGVALARFGENTIQPGRPLATLEETLVPVYLLHRYQQEAVVKSIGGTVYTYALRGDGQAPVTPVGAEEQRRALNALLDALSPETLALPEALLKTIPPRPAGFPRNRELFANHTGGNFDALAPAEAAAGLLFAGLFDPARAARLVEQHARDEQLPGLEEMLEEVVLATWQRRAEDGYAGEVQRTVDVVMLAKLIELAADADASSQVRAMTAYQLKALQNWLAKAQPADGPVRAHFEAGARLIGRFFDNPKDFEPVKIPAAPPGQPIGMDCEF